MAKITSAIGNTKFSPIFIVTCNSIRIVNEQSNIQKAFVANNVDLVNV